MPAAEDYAAPPMFRSFLLPVLMVACTLPGRIALGAEVRLAVDWRGTLRVPASTIRRLGVKSAANGMVCIQFPPTRRPAPFASPRPGAAEADIPSRIWTPLSPDGSLLLRRTRLAPGREVAPGPPGTVFLAAMEEGRLVLRRPPAPRKADRTRRK